MRVMGIHQDGGVGLRSARWKAALVVLVVGALAEHALAQAPVCRFSKEITPIDCRRANLGSVVGSGATAGVSSGAWWALALAYGSGGVSPTFVESCSGGFDQVVEHFSAPGCSPVTFVSECRLDAEVHAGVGGAPGDYAEVLVAAGADGIVLPAVGLAIGARAAGVVLPPTTYTFAVNGIVPSLSVVFSGTVVPPPSDDLSSTSQYVVASMVTELEKLGGSAEARARAMAGAGSKVVAETLRSHVRTEVSAACTAHGVNVVSMHDASIP